MVLDQKLSNGRQIVGDHAPTDPTLHTQFAMSQAADQVSSAAQLTDAAFDGSNYETTFPFRKRWAARNQG